MENKALPEDAQGLKDALGKQIRVSNCFLKCVSFLGQTFVNRLTTNTHVMSIMSEMNKNQDNHSEDWRPSDNVNKRGIDWSVAMLVQKGDWVKERTKKELKKVKENRRTSRPCKCELMLPDDVNTHVTKDHEFKEKHSFFVEKL